MGSKSAGLLLGDCFDDVACEELLDGAAEETFGGALLSGSLDDAELLLEADDEDEDSSEELGTLELGVLDDEILVPSDEVCFIVSIASSSPLKAETHTQMKKTPNTAVDAILTHLFQLPYFHRRNTPTGKNRNNASKIAHVF